MQAIPTFWELVLGMISFSTCTKRTTVPVTTQIPTCDMSAPFLTNGSSEHTRGHTHLYTGHCPCAYGIQLTCFNTCTVTMATVGSATHSKSLIPVASRSPSPASSLSSYLPSLELFTCPFFYRSHITPQISQSLSLNPPLRLHPIISTHTPCLSLLLSLSRSHPAGCWLHCK